MLINNGIIAPRLWEIINRLAIIYSVDINLSACICFSHRLIGFSQSLVKQMRTRAIGRLNW